MTLVIPLVHEENPFSPIYFFSVVLNLLNIISLILGNQNFNMQTHLGFKKGLLNFIFLSIFVDPIIIQAQETGNGEWNKNHQEKSGIQNPERKPGGGKGVRQMPVVLNKGNLVMGAPTTSSVTANIILGKDYEYFIEYGTVSDQYNFKTPLAFAANELPVELTISNLKPNSRYYYRLNYRQKGQKEYIRLSESWFATQKRPDTEFVFGVQGDSHPERTGKMFNPEYYRQTISSVSAIMPDFYFLMGDDFSIDRLIENNSVTQSAVEEVYKKQRYFLGNAGINPPLFLVNGNHEQAAKYLLNGSVDNAAVQAGLARKKYFPLPAPGSFYTGDTDTVEHIGLLKDYYAFEWGAALFIVIDPYWHSDEAVDNQPASADGKKNRNPWGATLGEAQYKWLKQTLENSKAPFKFVFAHHVNGTGRGGVERADLFEWGGKGQNGQWQFDKNRPGWTMPIHQLMVKNKVAIFFQGHDHLFAKQEKDGIIYQSVPNPADDTHTAFNKEAYTSGIVLPNSGFLKVIVSDTEVKVEYVRTYSEDKKGMGDEITGPFTYTIKKSQK